MKQKTRLIRRLAAALMLAVIPIASPTATAAVEKLPYMIYEGENTEMTVLWQMTNTQSCTIEWGLDTNYTTGSFATTEFGDDHQHKYTIPNLTPGTKYYYNVVGVGSGSFRAAPAGSATAVKFLAFGDTRTNPTDHNDVAAEMINTYTSDPAFETVALCSGDYTGSDSEAEWSSGWFNPNLTSLATFNSNMPISGCRGNHEGTGYRFKKYLPYPYVDKFYWSYDYGPVHVIVLDEYTNYSVGSPQYNWLVADLEANTKQWIFMMYHAPAWSAGGHGNDTQAQVSFQPLAQQYGVDLIIAGDNHYYSRHDVNGIQHITTGGAGAPLRTPKQDADYLEFAEEVNHHCEITVNGDVLTFVARRVDGTVMDSFTHTDSPAAPAWNTNPVVAKVAAPTLGYAEKLNKFVVDPNGDPLTFTKISGPAWLTVASDGSLSGTPSISELGLNSFVIEAADGITGSDTTTVNITVAVQATSEAEDAELSGSSFSTHSSGYTGTGYAVMTAPGSYIEWTVASTAAMPHEISFRSETDGDNAMTITVNGVVVDSNYTLAETSGWGFSSVATVSLNPGANTIRLTRVSGPNAIRMDHLLLTEKPSVGAPSFTADPINTADAVVDVAYSGSIAGEASDPESDPITFSKVSGPAWLSVAFNGTLSGTPAVGDVGANAFTVQVDAADGSDTTTLNITVDSAGPVVSTHEAEDAVLFDSIVGTYTSGYTGSAYTVMKTAGNSYVEWTVNLSAAGSADISFRHYTNSDNIMTITVNGVVVDSNYTLAGTGRKWRMSSVTAGVSLNAGANTIRLTRDSGPNHIRMDHLRVEAVLAVGNEAPVFTVDPINEANATEAISFAGSVAHATDAEGDTLTYSKLTGPAWLVVGTDGSLSGIPTAGDVGANVFTVQVDDGNGGTDTATLNITVDEFIVADQAISGVQTQGTTSGTLADSSASDDVYQVLTESGDPSALEYEWTFNVLGGELVTFYVEAYHTVNSEGDDFVFAFSTNGTDYTEMGTVVDTVDDDMQSWYALPSGLSGAVYVRVQDTDRTVGNSVADSLYIDEIIIVSEDSTVAPAVANAPVPADGSVDIAINQNLAWTAGAMTVSQNVFFGTNPTLGGADFQGNQSVSTFEPGVLAYSTTYYWAIEAVNQTGKSMGPVWSLTTAAPANTAPQFDSDPVAKVAANENTAYTATLVDDASDVDSDLLNFSKVSGPAWLSVASDGTLSGTPSNSDLGLNSWTVSVTDGITASVNGTLNITVLEPVISIHEAEDAVRFDSTLSTHNSGYTGSHYVVIKTAGNSYIEWTVNQAAAVSANLSFRHRSEYDNTMTITVNGLVVDSNYTLAGSGGTWGMSSVTAGVSLNAGNNTIRLTRDSGSNHVRLDHLLVEETP